MSEWDGWNDLGGGDAPGTLSVLNVGAGDLKFSFDPAKPAEVERARKTVEDMLRRGYTLLVEIDGELHKAKGFDARRNEYIILDTSGEPATEDAAEEGSAGTPKKAKRGRPRGVPAATTRATALAPTAGG